MSWIKLVVADPGVVYRVFWCTKCQSLRYHKVLRLQIIKTDTEWQVFLSRTCSGLPPAIYGKRPTPTKECKLETREWLASSQWNVLVQTDVYAA